MSATIQDVQDYLYDHIPITQHLGIQVMDATDTWIKLSAPLEANLNHRNTAFGGSLSSIGIMAGWALLHRWLTGQGLSVRLVIQHSEMDFLKPVDDDFVAKCQFESPDACARFINMLKRKGKARMTLNTDITCHEQVMAKNKGDFVAVLISPMTSGMSKGVPYA